MIAMVPYILKITWSPEKGTVQFTLGSHPNSLSFVLVRISPTQRVWERLLDVCYNGKSMRRYGFYSKSNPLLVIPISMGKKKLENLMSVKWNHTHESTLHLNRAL